MRIRFRGNHRALRGPAGRAERESLRPDQPDGAHHVAAELDGRIPLIVDAGATMHGLESTIVAVRNGRLEILRRGLITAEELRKFGEVVVIDRPRRSRRRARRNHITRRARRSCSPRNFAVAIPDEERYGALVWSDVAIPSTFAESRRVSATGDLREAAANLFRELRELDAASLDCIVAEAMPEKVLGAAIMDRLRRAAHR